jgi:hypothetical protein
MTATTFYPVPAGTPAAKCGGTTCGATIFWITTSGGRRVPADCDVEGGRRPSMTNDTAQSDLFAGTAAVYDGRGVHHSTECPDRDEFRKSS